MRPNGHTVRRLKKILWHFYVPAFVENYGVLLPTKHDLISDGIRRQIFFSEYELKEAEIVYKRLSADDVVVEVGAGTGFLSAYCAKEIGNDNFFAYEANSALMGVIDATHKATGWRNRISLLRQLNLGPENMHRTPSPYVDRYRTIQNTGVTV